MKRIFLILLPLGLGAYSCGEPNSTTNSTETERLDTAAVSEQLLPSLDENILANFPKNWVQVIPKKDSIIYKEYCGMGHPCLDIIKDEGVWQIMCVYGQDAETWELIGITANEKTINNQTIQDGVFTVIKITYPDDQTYSVDYFWNKTSGIATFGDFFGPDQSFADNANKDKFIIQKEECDF